MNKKVNIFCVGKVHKAILIVLFLSSMPSAYAQVRLIPQDSLKVVTLLTQQQDAWNQGNIDAFMEGYLKSERLVFSGATGPVYGWEATRDRYKKNYPDKTAMGTLGFEFLDIQQLDQNIIQLQGKFHLERTIGNSWGFFTLIFKKIDDQWYIVSDHTSSGRPKNNETN